MNRPRMERTELREQFFAEVKRDPWSAATMHLYADGWALGYEQALRDVARHLRDGEQLAGLAIGQAADETDSLRERESHADRVDRALEQATAARSEAEKIIGLAELGAVLHSPICRECGQPSPGPHLGTCSRSMMRGGPGY